MFIEALFKIAKTQKQLKCPTTEEWIKKMWYIYITYVYVCDIYSIILLSHLKE